MVMGQGLSPSLSVCLSQTDRHTQTDRQTHTQHTHTHTHALSLSLSLSHTHTHTNTRARARAPHTIVDVFLTERSVSSRCHKRVIFIILSAFTILSHQSHVEVLCSLSLARLQAQRRQDKHSKYAAATSLQAGRATPVNTQGPQQVRNLCPAVIDTGGPYCRSS